MNIDKMTMAQLKELADQMGLEIPEGAKKADLIALIEAEAKDEPEAPEEPEEPEEAQEPEQEKTVYMAYVGPSIPGGLLSHGKILYGTKDSIREYLAPVLAKYPKIESLMVPVVQMGQAMKDVKNPNKLLYHKAQEVLNK